MVPVQGLARVGFRPCRTYEMPYLVTTGIKHADTGHRSVNDLAAFKHPHIVEFDYPPPFVVKRKAEFQGHLAVPDDV